MRHEGAAALRTAKLGIVVFLLGGMLARRKGIQGGENGKKAGRDARGKETYLPLDLADLCHQGGGTAPLLHRKGHVRLIRQKQADLAVKKAVNTPLGHGKVAVTVAPVLNIVRDAGVHGGGIARGKCHSDHKFVKQSGRTAVGQLVGHRGKELAQRRILGYALTVATGMDHQDPQAGKIRPATMLSNITNHA